MKHQYKNLCNRNFTTNTKQNCVHNYPPKVSEKKYLENFVDVEQRGLWVE